MTLEEMGRLARETVDEDNNCPAYAVNLARALLAVLPVARAAETWHVVEKELDEHAIDGTYAPVTTRQREWRSLDALRASIATMHTALAKGDV